jgi:hypothetical protein
MLFTPIAIIVALATSAVSSVPRTDVNHGRDNYNDMDNSFNIFEDSSLRFEGAICKHQITTRQFPTLQVPYGFEGGCVRCKFSFTVHPILHLSFSRLPFEYLD